MPKVTKEDALLYHSRGRHGKVEVIPTKPYSTQFDLSLALKSKTIPRMFTTLQQRGIWLPSFQTEQQFSD